MAMETKSDDGWPCEQCTLINSTKSKKCKICEHPRGSGEIEPRNNKKTPPNRKSRNLRDRSGGKAASYTEIESDHDMKALESDNNATPQKSSRKRPRPKSSSANKDSAIQSPTPKIFTVSSDDDNEKEMLFIENDRETSPTKEHQEEDEENEGVELVQRKRSSQFIFKDDESQSDEEFEEPSKGPMLKGKDKDEEEVQVLQHEIKNDGQVSSQVEGDFGTDAPRKMVIDAHKEPSKSRSKRSLKDIQIENGSEVETIEDSDDDSDRKGRRGSMRLRLRKGSAKGSNSQEVLDVNDSDNDFTSPPKKTSSNGSADSGWKTKSNRSARAAKESGSGGGRKRKGKGKAQEQVPGQTSLTQYTTRSSLRKRSQEAETISIEDLQENEDEADIQQQHGVKRNFWQQRFRESCFKELLHTGIPSDGEEELNGSKRFSSKVALGFRLEAPSKWSHLPLDTLTDVWQTKQRLSTSQGKASPSPSPSNHNTSPLTKSNPDKTGSPSGYCQQCKKWKVRCDQKEPQCSRCEKLEQTCLYPAGGPSEENSKNNGDQKDSPPFEASKLKGTTYNNVDIQKVTKWLEETQDEKRSKQHIQTEEQQAAPRKGGKLSLRKKKAAKKSDGNNSDNEATIAQDQDHTPGFKSSPQRMETEAENKYSSPQRSRTFQESPNRRLKRRRPSEENLDTGSSDLKRSPCATFSMTPELTNGTSSSEPETDDEQGRKEAEDAILKSPLLRNMVKPLGEQKHGMAPGTAQIGSDGEQIGKDDLKIVCIPCFKTTSGDCDNAQPRCNNCQNNGLPCSQKSAVLQKKDSLQQLDKQNAKNSKWTSLDCKSTNNTDKCQTCPKVDQPGDIQEDGSNDSGPYNKSDAWACTHCTFENEGGRASCEMCDNQRPDLTESSCAGVIDFSQEY